MEKIYMSQKHYAGYKKNGRNMYVTREYFFDGREVLAKEYDSEYKFSQFSWDDRLKQFLSEYGLHTRYCSAMYLEQEILEPCVEGHVNFAKLVEEKCRIQAESREKRQKDLENWRDLEKRFGGQIIGIDKNIDVFSTGFSVRVIMRTGLDFEERRSFIREHCRDLVKYVMNELTDSKKVMNRIGDIKFYKPTSITVLRISEVEIKFEVKNIEIMQSV